MGNLLGQPVTEKETHRGSIKDDLYEDLDYAVSSMQGWRVHMEDAHICQPTLYAEEEIPSPEQDGIVSADGSGDNAATAAAEKEEEETTENSGQNKKAKKDHESEGNTESAANNTTTPATPQTSSNENLHKKTRRIDLPGHSLFAVFDGHGGSFAAEYAGQNFCRVLSHQPAFVYYAEYVQNKLAAESCPSNSSDAMTPAQQAQMDHKGLAALECALRDAFIELDREIFLKVQDAVVKAQNAYQQQEEDQHNPDHNEHGGGQESSNEQMNSNGNDENGENNNNHDKIATPNPDEDSGTTAVVTILTPQWIVCANAGDSRAVYSKNNNQKDNSCTIPLSYDHKPDDEAEERRIMDAGGEVRGGRVDGDLAVSRGLGDFRFKEAEPVLAGQCLWLQKVQHALSDKSEEGGTGGARKKKRDSKSSENKNMILPDDQKVSPVPDIIVQNRNRDLDEFIIVACDGIWDVQSNQQCVKLISDIFAEGESDLGLLCEEILDACLIMGSKDNMTALVVKLPAQQVGNGGGVMERRTIRENTLEDEDC